MSRSLLLIAGISGALAVTFGALGAHELRGQLDVYATMVYTKAFTYQIYHTLALFGVGILAINKPSRWLHASGILFIAGIVLFSGSLFIIALTGNRQFGMITPFGGVAWIAGWLSLAIAGFKR